jgi:hypothetical protein
MLCAFSIGLLALLSSVYAKEITDKALLEVEADQATVGPGAGGLENLNLLRGRYKYYSHSSSYASGRFANRAIDGDAKSGWALDKKDKKGWVDVSIGLPVTADKIVIHEGGSQITQFKVMVYDGDKWVELASGGALGTKEFLFKPTKISSVRVEVHTTGGGGIAEIEMYNTADPDAAFPNGPSRDFRKLFSKGRVAIYLGSPLLLNKTGVDYIIPREQEVRPLANSSMYMPHILDALAKEFGKSAKNIPDLSGIKTESDVMKAYETFMASIGVPMTVYPEQPKMIVLGPPLPKEVRSDVLRQAAALLNNVPGSGYTTPGVFRPNQSADIVIQPTTTVVGKTMQWVGTRGSIDSPSDGGWLSYIRPNAARTWWGAGAFGKYVSKPAEKINTVDEFDALKKKLRSDPEKFDHLRWDSLSASEHAKQMEMEFTQIKKSVPTIINCTGPKDWKNTWTDHWHNWMITYASAFYLAKNYDIAIHQYGNEPDGYLRILPEKEIAFKLMLVGDAIHCAVEDVNRIYNKKLVSQYAAPVLASDPCSNVARVMMKNLRTDYHGNKVNKDIVQFYNRHRYSDRARQNVTELELVHEMMLEESATGKAIPQIFTELNVSTGGNWSRPHITWTSDSPHVIHSMGSIWGMMMERQLAHGIFLFKFNSIQSRWGNTVLQEFYKESDAGTPVTFDKGKRAEAEAEVGNASKNALILGMFAEGFANAQDLYKTAITKKDLHYQAYTTYNPANQRYYIWSVQVNEEVDYNLKFDLSALGVLPGAQVLVKEVSAGRFGEITHNVTLGADKTVSFTQPRASVCLISVPKNKVLTVSNYSAIADASIRQGEFSSANFGNKPSLHVARKSNTSNNHISFIKFKVDKTIKDTCNKASLRMYGQRLSEYDFDEPYVVRVYGLVDDQWEEMGITAANAPAINRTVSAVRSGVISVESPPTGHMSLSKNAGFSEIDVTYFLKDHKDDVVTFLLIRELRWPGENTDFSGAQLTSREGDKEQVPRLQIQY